MVAVRVFLAIALASTIPGLLGIPAMVGVATYYGGEAHVGQPMFNGATFNPDAFTCAVDDSQRELIGRTLAVCDADNCILMKATDTGYLDEAGLFKWSIQRIGGYWVEWFHPSPVGHNVVIDLTPAAYETLEPRGLVSVWVVK